MEHKDKLADLVNGVDSEARKFKGTFEEYQNLREKGEITWEKPANDVVENSPSAPSTKVEEAVESSPASSVVDASEPSKAPDAQEDSANQSSLVDEALEVDGIRATPENSVMQAVDWTKEEAVEGLLQGETAPTQHTIYAFRKVAIPGSDPVTKLVEFQQVRDRVPGRFESRFAEGMIKGESFSVADENLDTIKEYIIRLDDLIDQIAYFRRGFKSKIQEKLDDLPIAHRLRRKEEFEFIHGGKAPRAPREPREKKEKLGFNKVQIDGFMKLMKSAGAPVEQMIEMLRKEGTLTPEIAEYVEKNFGETK